LPEGRGKLCAAYDPSGALVVCGGGERFWRPNANCWQVLAGHTDEWAVIPQMYPVHGAATTFYNVRRVCFKTFIAVNTHTGAEINVISQD
jgi:hypothetical protein